MADQMPFTIEILGYDDDRPVVLDRVIGGSVYLEEAKRIGRYLLSIADVSPQPVGYRVVTYDEKLVYDWRSGLNDNAPPRTHH